MYQTIATTGTLTDDYIENYYRVGVIPWSDARHWFNGGIQVVDGKQITGPAADRPLYPIFLSFLFTLTGDRYESVIYAQLAVMALVLTVAYAIMRPLRPRATIVLFFTFMAIWRPATSTIFMTENLGIYGLVLAFSMILRGLLTESRSFTCSGFFFLGLAQAARPWCLASLATAPLIALTSSEPWRKRFLIFIVYAIFTSSGFALHGLATAFFSAGSGFSNIAHTLYGQVTGGRRWDAIYADPVVGDLVSSIEPLTSDQTRKVYSRIIALFLEDPSAFIDAARESLRQYCLNIPKAFSIIKPTYFLGFLVLVTIVDAGCRPNAIVEAIKKMTAIRILVGIFMISAIVLVYSMAWTMMSILGLIWVCSRRLPVVHGFIMLYLLGIFLSLPFVAADGGQRVRIGSDILLFLSAAVGASGLLLRVEPMRPEPLSPSRSGLSSLAMPAGVVVIGYLLFVGMPLVYQWTARRTPHSRSDLSASGLFLNSENVSHTLKLTGSMVGPRELEALWKKFPNRSFETLGADTWGYYPIRYQEQDSLYFEMGEGVPLSSRNPELWPLLPSNIRRTILVLERRFTLFPNVRKETLNQFNDQDMVVVGKLLIRPRPYRSATGFVLVVHYIGTGDRESHLVWQAISELRSRDANSHGYSGRQRRR